MKTTEIPTTYQKTLSDSVNHPKHYNVGKIEVIDAIDEWKLDFCLGNAVKYIARAGHKNSDTEIEDLKKAVFYINRRITQLVEKQNEDEDCIVLQAPNFCEKLSLRGTKD